MEQKRRSGKNRRRKRRRQRIIRAWTARILILGTPLLIIGLLAAGILRHGRQNVLAEEASFMGAVHIGSAWSDPDRLTVVVDAGHGGRDQGTSAGDILEKDVNLDVARLVAKKLKKAGADVILTRDSDTYVGLEERADLANQADADLFVSIHCNYCEEDASVRGLECYYSEDSADGQLLAQQIVDQVETLDQAACRGTRTADYRVLLHTEMPAVLVELGYFSNRSERALLTDGDYQLALAEEIAAGLLQGQ